MAIDLDAIEGVIRDGRCPKNGCDDFLPLIAELRLARAVVEAAGEVVTHADGIRDALKAYREGCK
jgi:hypothetical protein